MSVPANISSVAPSNPNIGITGTNRGGAAATGAQAFSKEMLAALPPGIAKKMGGGGGQSAKEFAKGKGKGKGAETNNQVPLQSKQQQPTTTRTTIEQQILSQLGIDPATITGQRKLGDSQISAQAGPVFRDSQPETNMAELLKANQGQVVSARLA
jgi:hypothetical protein